MYDFNFLINGNPSITKSSVLDNILCTFVMETMLLLLLSSKHMKCSCEAELTAFRCFWSKYHIRDKVRICVMQAERRAKPHWRGVGIWFGRLPLKVFLVFHAERRSWGKPRTWWIDYISPVGWEHLGLPQNELVRVTGSENVRHFLNGPFIFRIWFGIKTTMN